MANPFHIPRQSLAEKALPYVNTLLRFRQLSLTGKELAQRGRISKAELGQEAAQFGRKYGPRIEGERGTGGVETEKMWTNRRLLELKEREATAQWEVTMAGPPNLPLLGMLAKKLPELFEGPVNQIKEGVEAKTIKNRWEVYNLLKPQQAMHVKKATEKLTKKIEGLIEKEKYQEAKQYGELLNGIQSPTFLEEFFGFPKEMMPEKGELDLPTVKIEKGLTPSAQLSQKKLDAWERVYAGAESEADRKLLNIDTAEKKIKALGDRYLRTLKSAQDAEMGVDQFIPEESRITVAQDRYVAARQILEQYEAAGGDPADLGIGEQIPSPGLDEETIRFNMQKYNKTRQEVIDQFNKRMGVQ